MIGVWNFPQQRAGIASVDESRVPHGDVAVDLSMDEQHRHVAVRDGLLGGDLLHVEPVFPASPKKGGLDDRTEKSTAKPRAGAKRLSHAVISDFTKIGERGLGSHGAQLRMRVERLKQFGRAHRFTEAEYASRMCFSFQKVNPLMNVITLDESVGREFSTARAMRTGVGQQYGESVGQKEIRISDHAQAIVGQ